MDKYLNLINDYLSKNTYYNQNNTESLQYIPQLNQETNKNIYNTEPKETILSYNQKESISVDNIPDFPK
jgi:hypothetical protein